MRLLDAVWTPKVNMLLLLCDCGKHLYHRADRWQVVCPRCKAKAHIADIRRQRFPAHP